MEFVSSAIKEDFDPAEASKHPVGRIYTYRNTQVVVSKTTGYEGNPETIVSFPMVEGVCSARSPFEPTDHGTYARDALYARLVGHKDIPGFMKSVIEAVWEDKGTPWEATDAV